MGGTTLDSSFTYGGILGAIALPQDVPLASRSVTFGVAEGQRFSIEGFFQQSAGRDPIALGGLEGARARRVDPTSGNQSTRRPVFSWDEIADKFLEDYFFEVPDGGVTIKMDFYFIVQ